MINILSRAILMSTPLLLGATAEVFAEKTGMMIIAIEGLFLVGAWAGFVGVYTTGSYLAGFLFAAVLGAIAAMVYGFITIYLKQHQIVTGTALNILLAGLVAFFHRVIFGIPLLPLTIEPLKNLPIPSAQQNSRCWSDPFQSEHPHIHYLPDCSTGVFYPLQDICRTHHQIHRRKSGGCGCGGN